MILGILLYNNNNPEFVYGGYAIMGAINAIFLLYMVHTCLNESEFYNDYSIIFKNKVIVCLYKVKCFKGYVIRQVMR